MGRPKRIFQIASATYRRYVTEIENWLLAIGHQGAGALQHGRQLERFFSWLESQGIQRINAIDPPVLVAYRTYLKSQVSLNDGGHLNAKTVYSHLRSVQLLYDLLLETGRTTYDPLSEVDLEYPKLQARREVLSQQEIQLLYRACENRSERALLSLAYGCGLRAAELSAVNVADIRFDQYLLVVPKGKNSRRRVIPLSEGVRRDLLLYHLGRRRYTSESRTAFLLNRRSTRMRAYTTNKKLRELADRAGICHKQISVHVLRHSIATHLLENGTPVDQVRVFLGHRLLRTTEVYIHVGDHRLQKMMLS